MRRSLGAMAAAVILAVAACERQSTSDAASARARDTAASAGAAVARTSGSQPAASQSAQSPGSVATPGPRVGVARAPQYGAYLTDGNGRALYLLEEDRPGESTCYEMCAVIWPPFLAGQSPPTAADSSIRTSLFGSSPRRGGSAQVTYNGHPLYYYLGDSGPGQTKGQHVEDSWGEWYLVSPSGRHVDESGRDSGRRGRGGRRGGADDDR